MRRLSSVFAFVLLLTLGCAQDTTLTDVKQAFANADIPSDLNINFDPQFLLEIVLPQSDSVPVLVHAGIQLERNATANKPVFTLINPSSPISGTPSGPFVVACVDPDAPTPTNPTNAQVRHFLGGNYLPIKLGSVTTPLLKNGTAPVSEWRQPTPRGGNHRYIFLVFEQPEGFNDQVLVTPTTPVQNFDIKEFADGVGLRNPIAGTFFMVANLENP